MYKMNTKKADIQRALNIPKSTIADCIKRYESTGTGLIKKRAGRVLKPDLLVNYQVFTETITTAFGDSDPVVSAETALRKLHQTSSVTHYATEFRRLSSLISWNEAALVYQFKTLITVKSFRE